MNTETLPANEPPQSATESSATNEPAAKGGDSGAARIEQALLGATKQVFGETRSEPSKPLARKPGQRGPDKAPRKRPVPVAGVAGGTVPSLLDDLDSGSNPGDGEAFPGAVPPSSDEAYQALAECVPPSLEFLGAIAVRSAAKKAYGDDQLAAKVKAIAFPEDLKPSTIFGWKAIIKEILKDPKYAPYVAAIIGTGAYAGAIGKQCMDIAADAKKANGAAS